MLVPFAGPGAGEGPLTWGQAQCWRAMVETRSSLAMGAVMVAPPGRTPEDYARTLSFWMSRYAALRTRLRLGPEPVQVVAGAGTAELRVVDSADPGRTADELLAGWKSTPFDYEREWPVRLAVVTRGGAVTHAVMVICHLAADTASVEVMNRELLDPDRGPYAAPQPLELAARQAGPAARRQSAASLRFWEAQLRAVPARRFPAPVDRPGARYRRLVRDSPALHGSTGGADPGAALLGAFALAVRDVLGGGPLVARVIVGNRFRPGLADVVAPLPQNGLCVLDVTGADRAEATRRAARATMAASKHAYYSPDDWQALLDRVDVERGEHVDLGLLWNDRRTRFGGPAAAARRPDREEAMDFFNERLMVHVEDVPGTVRISAEVDTRHLAAADVWAVLDRMESGHCP